MLIWSNKIMRTVAEGIHPYQIYKRIVKITIGYKCKYCFLISQTAMKKLYSHIKQVH